METTGLALERTLHVGPLPPADEIAAIGLIVPNGAERIMAMAEADARHVRIMQSRALNFEFVERIFRRLLAFLFASSGLCGTVYLAMNNHDWVAGTLGTTTIVGVVTALMVGRGSPTAKTPK